MPNDVCYNWIKSYTKIIVTIAEKQQSHNYMPHLLLITRQPQITTELSDKQIKHQDRTYNSRDGEVAAVHFLRQPLHLTPSVTEDDRLGDGQGLIQITQSIQLPLLATTSDTTLNRKPQLHLQGN